MLETCFVLNKSEEGIVDDEFLLKEEFNIFPVPIDRFKAEIAIEGMDVGASNNSNPGVGASFTMVELKLLYEGAFCLGILESQIEGS